MATKVHTYSRRPEAGGSALAEIWLRERGYLKGVFSRKAMTTIKENPRLTIVHVAAAVGLAVVAGACAESVFGKPPVLTYTDSSTDNAILKDQLANVKELSGNPNCDPILSTFNGGGQTPEVIGICHDNGLSLVFRKSGDQAQQIINKEILAYPQQNGDLAWAYGETDTQDPEPLFLQHVNGDVDVFLSNGNIARVSQDQVPDGLKIAFDSSVVEAAELDTPTPTPIATATALPATSTLEPTQIAPSATIAPTETLVPSPTREVIIRQDDLAYCDPEYCLDGKLEMSPDQQKLFFEKHLQSFIDLNPEFMADLLGKSQPSVEDLAAFLKTSTKGDRPYFLPSTSPNGTELQYMYFTYSWYVNVADWKWLFPDFKDGVFLSSPTVTLYDYKQWTTDGNGIHSYIDNLPHKKASYSYGSSAVTVGFGVTTDQQMIYIGGNNADDHIKYIEYGNRLVSNETIANAYLASIFRTAHDYDPKSLWIMVPLVKVQGNLAVQNADDLSGDELFFSAVAVDEGN